MAASFQSPVRNHLSVCKPNDARRVLQQSLIVRRENERETEAAVQVAHKIDQLCRVARIEVRSRLVGQH